MWHRSTYTYFMAGIVYCSWLSSGGAWPAGLPGHCSPKSSLSSSSSSSSVVGSPAFFFCSFFCSICHTVMGGLVLHSSSFSCGRAFSCGFSCGMAFFGAAVWVFGLGHKLILPAERSGFRIVSFGMPLFLFFSLLSMRSLFMYALSSSESITSIVSSSHRQGGNGACPFDSEPLAAILH